MSDDSSKSPVSSRDVLPGWLTAVIILLATVFLFFGAELIGSLILSAYGSAHFATAAQVEDWLTGSIPAQFTFGLIADGVLLLGIYVIMRWLGWNWRTIGFHWPKLIHIVIGVLAVVPYLILYLLIAIALKVVFPGLNFDQKQEIGFNNVYGLGATLLTFLSLVVLPPLAEETAMRGFLYTGLKRLFPWTIAGLLVSILFGAAHLAEGGASGPLWIGAIDTFTLSLVLVFLREKTGNLWAGIALHATKNFVAFYMLFIIGVR